MPLPSAQTAKRGDAFVVNLKLGEGFGELIRVVLGIGARPGDGPDVNNEPDFAGPQQLHELLDRAGRVSDGEE